MKRALFLVLTICFGFGVLAFASVAEAGDGREKSVVPKSKHHPLSNLWSGFYYAKPETQTMQMDDFENPGMIYVDEGRDIWNAEMGPKNLACASCHKDAAVSMRQAGARYPVYYGPLKRLINLAQRINICREEFQKVKPLKY